MARPMYPSVRRVPPVLAAVTRAVSRAHPASADNITREEPTEPMPVLQRGTDHVGEPRLMLVKTEGGKFKPASH